MGVIFDTSVWVELSRGTLDQAHAIETLGDAPVFVSVISLGELEFGVQSCASPEERAVRASNLRQIERRSSLGISARTANAFGLLCASVKASGRSPRPRVNDLWIAAQCIEHGHDLYTLNIKDFLGLPGLRVIEARELRSPARARGPRSLSA